MTADYTTIQADNRHEYGAGIGRWGRDLLANRYDDRTHFIFEILQNAEDALARRTGWSGSRAVTFRLSATELRIGHCGMPFNDLDVRGICGIGESTKELTEIGRFGIGFKSVYAYTDRPEVHSGEESFAIESYVLPVEVPTIQRHSDETVFILPLRADDATARDEIADGLQRLGARVLLFLRHIEEIEWSVEGGASGHYVRDNSDEIGNGVNQVLLLGKEGEKADDEESWLLFSRAVTTDDGRCAGHVQIAYSIMRVLESLELAIRPVDDSPLVVFFPTVLPTHLGFLVQGPYRTTPSRDNVPRADPWNQLLVYETAALLVQSLRWLRDSGLLTVDAFRCLPLDRAHSRDGNMFAPVYAAVRDALGSERLLPSARGHITAAAAKLARTQEVRRLFNPDQLKALFGADIKQSWLSGDITQDRAPELRQYLMYILGIVEVTPEAIIPKLTRAFLQSQTNEWTRRFYEFLNGQVALLKQGRLRDVPLVRLEDGTHVTPVGNGRPQAFLPGPIETDFPTVSRLVCETPGARALLEALGLTEPDAVDDVLRNVLPKYEGAAIVVSDDENESDVARILAAYRTDSKSQRDKLVAALRKSAFVQAVSPLDGSKWFAVPGGVYIATPLLRDLLAGVDDVLLVDDSYAYLRGDQVRSLLEASGASPCLQTIQDDSGFSWEELREMRLAAGCVNTSGNYDTISDNTLRDLDSLIQGLPSIDVESRAKRASLLWDALEDLLAHRGPGVFSGNYRWTYHQPRSCSFDAAFVRKLNACAWVPDESGEIQRPETIDFEKLGWKSNPFLLSRIHFRPPVIEALAKEAGITSGLIDLLKRLGVTSEAELRSRFQIEEPEDALAEDTTASKETLPSTPKPKTPASLLPTAHNSNADSKTEVVSNSSEAPIPPSADPSETELSRLTGSRTSGSREATSGGGPSVNTVSGDMHTGASSGGATSGARHTSAGERTFVSYVAAEPADRESDSDGLDQQARLALEEKAIALILARDPSLKRTPTNNPGFDLFVEGPDGEPLKWVEVKAMKGTLQDHPVGISSTQLDFARKRENEYWLYVVERADSPNDARIVRIQDPYGKARTFTFDKGWLDVALIEPALGK